MKEKERERERLSHNQDTSSVSTSLDFEFGSFQSHWGSEGELPLAIDMTVSMDGEMVSPSIYTTFNLIIANSLTLSVDPIQSRSLG